MFAENGKEAQAVGTRLVLQTVWLRMRPFMLVGAMHVYGIRPAQHSMQFS